MKGNSWEGNSWKESSVEARIQGEAERLEDFLKEWKVAVEPSVLEQKRMRILRKFRFHLSRKQLEPQLGLEPRSPEWEAIRLCLRMAVYDATLPPLFQVPLSCAPSSCGGCQEGCS
ncbi:hypothetical protein [Gorillibacterium sp. CAU 1737]|uniref:hypothetical protein n=1 Tax=Gorillibacterium sp. CAU 1737 TaxID=3140362 RepID=UPI003261CB25